MYCLTTLAAHVHHAGIEIAKVQERMARVAGLDNTVAATARSLGLIEIAADSLALHWFTLDSRHV
jgi:hypothetical protein